MLTNREAYLTLIFVFIVTTLLLGNMFLSWITGFIGLFLLAMGTVKLLAVDKIPKQKRRKHYIAHVAAILLGILFLWSWAVAVFEIRDVPGK